MPISAQKKKFAVDEVLKRKQSVSEVARRLGVSRKTIYSWLKQYRQAPPRLKSKVFVPRYVTGKKHPRAVAYKTKRLLTKMIVAHPEWGCRRLSQELKKKGFDLGYFGVNKLLQSLGASTPELRKEFVKNWSGPGRLTPSLKMKVIQDILGERASIAQKAQEHNIARKTIYEWIKRYQSAKEKGIIGAAALKEAYVRGENHPRAVAPEVGDQVLKIVIEKPQLSIHDLANLVPASSWTVWKILSRYNLTSYQQRLAYAQSRQPVVTPALGVLDTLKRLIGQIPAISAIPPPSFRFDSPQLRKLGKILGVYFFSLTLASYLLFSWLGLITQAPSLSVKLGLILATISLGIGSFFFAYSMKYYLTLTLVLSFSRETREETSEINPQSSAKNGNGGILGLLARIFGVGVTINNRTNERSGIESPITYHQPPTTRKGLGLKPDLSSVKLERHPFVSIHLPLYNEKRVVERLLRACSQIDYPHFEIIVIDDSTDETTKIVQRFANHWNKTRDRDRDRAKEKDTQLKSPRPRLGSAEGGQISISRPLIKVIHRKSRSGFKGGALKEALKHMDKKTEFVVVFDADFVPYPDTLEMFVKYFKAANQGKEDYQASDIAVVGGYQWHVLNKSENWITRGVRTEYSGSYVVERAGREILGLLKQISGSVYMIRADVLKGIGWGTSITEDFQLTLKLYEQGYKVVYTPYIQAPAECVSTLKRLIKQRMRWAHQKNVYQINVWPLAD
jgi:glycosyltransferase involved in cell wall biosynthesis/transposase-like protein